MVGRLGWQIAWTLFISPLWSQNRLRIYQSAILAYGAVTVAIGAFVAVKAAEGPLYTVGALQAYIRMTIVCSTALAFFNPMLFIALTDYTSHYQQQLLPSFSQ
jgi:hypothetical protein